MWTNDLNENIVSSKYFGVSEKSKNVRWYLSESLDDKNACVCHSWHLNIIVNLCRLLNFSLVELFLLIVYQRPYTGWNDKIVALEKTWFHFRSMKTGFLFLLQTINYLASYAEIPRAIGAFYHVWEWHNVQRARSEMGRCTTMLSTDPSYDNRTITSTLKMQILIATNMLCPGWWKQSFRLWLWSLVWFQVRATSCHLTSSKSAWKSTPKMCWRVRWSPGAIRWPVAYPGCSSRTRRRPTSPKRPRFEFRKSATTLYPSLTGPPPPRTWTRWTTSFGHTSRTSPTWPPTTPKPAGSPPSAEYSPSSRRQQCKRHAPSSGSVSRRWLRLKADTLNRYQPYYIIKLPELIFSIKVLK